MTQNEKNLIHIIRESDNPEAIRIATEIIISYLKQLESSKAPSPVDREELD